MVCCCAGNVGSDGEEWGSNVLPPTDAVPLPDAQPTVAALLKPGSSDQPGDTGITTAAVLKPDYIAALDRHNMYRTRHQVRLPLNKHRRCMQHVLQCCSV